MLHRSETYSLRENEIAIVRRIEFAMVTAMRCVQSVRKRRSLDLVDLLVLEDTFDGLAMEVECNDMNLL